MDKNSKRVITTSGLKEAQEKLEYLTSVRRREVTEQIATARGFGDLSENAEYDEALNEQSRLEGEISELQEYIRNAVIVDENKVNIRTVNIGSKVTVYDAFEEDTVTYYIVGARESDPLKGKISNESPIGAALMGHKKGDVVKVEAPAGMYELEIKKIERMGK
ncbi:MAG: transcription elongation factor GreA [Christensenellaceae bacterium]|nr:transcription elongation factor GreA [Christensenellaceae bacterium]